MPDDKINSSNIATPDAAAPKGCSVPKEPVLEESIKLESVSFDKKEDKFSVIDSQNKGTVVCDVLDLNKEEDLKKFNYILNEQNKDITKSHITVKLLERQYNSTLCTWQILAIYETHNCKIF